MVLEDRWPLFGLRLVTERLELRTMRETDLVVIAALVPDDAEPDPRLPRFGFADPGAVRATMSFQSYWSSMGGWRMEDWRLGFLARLRAAGALGPAGCAVGVSELEAQGFLVRRTVHTGSWLIEEARGQGYGKEMRAAMLTLAFAGLGATVAETEALDDNPASLGVSRALGYEPNGEEIHDHNGTPARMMRLRLVREAWDARARALWPTRIEGLEPAKVLFGLRSGGTAGSVEPEVR
jgi:RimJ/RimL family protein N-acetyltransferase